MVWEWEDEGSYPRIIAYRIIPEAKSEYDTAYTHFNNTNYCQCEEPLLYARQSEIPHGASYACCSKCQKSANPCKKEPHKQTLLEYAHINYESNINKANHDDLLVIIGEYLENNCR